MEALTSPPGGNKVDGLPPASSDPQSFFLSADISLRVIRVQGAASLTPKNES